MKKFTDPANLKKIAWILLVIGGLYLGLEGLLNFNIGNGFFARVLYTLIGIATVYTLLYQNKAPHTPLRK